MPSAIASVLGTPELLVNILEYLPTNLLHAQRINHQCHALILTTKKLQQALFYLPITASSPTTTGTEINTLLQSKFPLWLTNWRYLAFGHLPVTAPLSSFYGIDFPLENLEAFTRSEASWRKMLLCQPPIQNLRIQTAYSKRGLNAPRWSTVLDYTATGLRMGDFHDVLWSCFPAGVPLVEDFDRASAGLDWCEHGRDGNRERKWRRGACEVEPLPRFLEREDGTARVVEHVDVIVRYCEGGGEGRSGEEMACLDDEVFKFRSEGFESTMVGLMTTVGWDEW